MGKGRIQSDGIWHALLTFKPRRKRDGLHHYPAISPPPSRAGGWEG